MIWAQTFIGVAKLLRTCMWGSGVDYKEIKAKFHLFSPKKNKREKDLLNKMPFCSTEFYVTLYHITDFSC